MKSKRGKEDGNKRECRRGEGGRGLRIRERNTQNRREGRDRRRGDGGISKRKNSEQKEMKMRK